MSGEGDGPLVLVADDDDDVRELVVFRLERAGYRVVTAADGEEALDVARSHLPRVCVIDVMRPKLDGFEVTERLRESDELAGVAILLLTASVDEASVDRGMAAGADDYIKKPFSQRLLIERIRALIRRGELARERDDPQGEPVIVRGRLTLDPARHLCTWNSEQVELTVTEFLILKSLAHRPGHVKNRDQLMDAAYGEHIYVDDRTIDSHIKRLRKKFKAVDTDFAQIETLYGVGYRYRDR